MNMVFMIGKTSNYYEWREVYETNLASRSLDGSGLAANAEEKRSTFSAYPVMSFDWIYHVSTIE